MAGKSSKTIPKRTQKQKRAKSGYKKFRVRGHIKSFRDLEIYRATTELSTEIFAIRLHKNLKNKKLLEAELEILRVLAKQVPRLVSEAYGDKFVEKSRAYAKLEKAMRTCANIIAKLDFLAGACEQADSAAIFAALVKKYQIQSRKILNLKRAWIRIAEKYDKKTSGRD